MADKKTDPTIKTTGAPEVSGAADAAADKKYADNPDKPDPTTVAQVEVLPEDK